MNTDEAISWIISNTSATNTIIRALGAAMQDNPAFVDGLKTLHSLRAGNFLASQMTDREIEEYEKALKELLPPSVRNQVFP